MDSTALRLSFLAAAGVALALGAACTQPSGAKFSPTTGVLTIYGTGGGDLLVVRALAGAIVVNGGAMPIRGGTPTLANTLRIEVIAREGADYVEIDESGGAMPPARLVGGPGADVLVGGSGDDTVEGGEGDDVALLGDGDDTAIWRSNGGLDTIEGEAGTDTLRFEGHAGPESIDVVANDGRVLFYQDATETNDLDGVEVIEYRARAGADTVVVGDLSGTAAAQISLDLAGDTGGGDGEADTVTVLGTNGDDEIGASGDAAGMVVFGLQANVYLTSQEAGRDRLIVNALGGHDVVDATSLAAGGADLTLTGGLGNDVLLGGAGDDAATGGDGNDFVLLGAGDDTFTWNPGDDNDTVEGQEGFDAVVLNGSSVAETVEIAPNGGRIRLTRNVASVVFDLNGVEAIDYLGRSGADVVVVNDVSATDLVEVNVDLLGTNGVADLAVDSVLMRGTPGDDTVQIFGDATQVSAVGRSAQVNLLNPEGAFDGLTVATFGGDDVIYAAGLASPSLLFTGDGGDDHDVLIGGDGADVLLGGDGDDLLQGGPGLDVLDGGLGDNVVIQ